MRSKFTRQMHIIRAIYNFYGFLNSKYRRLCMTSNNSFMYYFCTRNSSVAFEDKSTRESLIDTDKCLCSSDSRVFLIKFIYPRQMFCSTLLYYVVFRTWRYSTRTIRSILRNSYYWIKVHNSKTTTIKTHRKMVCVIWRHDGYINFVRSSADAKLDNN